jgi:hypothetical protein
MRSLKVWSSLAASLFLLMAGFQNCSPVAFKEATDGIVEAKSTITQKTCDLEKKKEGETWMAAAGQARQLVACEVGVGNQFKIFDITKEFQCSDGTAVATGRENRSPAGIDGVCDLNCGDHKNGEKWWVELGTSVETLQCPTSVDTNSTVKYSNSAEYTCSNAVASATGKLDKKRLEETACPSLTFNDQDNQATLAFEDVYPKPLDSDYDDFVTNFKAVETYSSIGELTKITLEYKAKHKGGGLGAKLITVFDGIVRGRDGWVSNQNIFKSEPMFNGAASIQVDLYQGSTLLSTSMAQKNSDLIVFDSAADAVSKSMSARITITGIDGKSNLLKDRKGLSIKRYRTLLYVPDSGNYSKVKRYDIDMSDVNPSAYDEAGRPLAFFVPVNWHAPKDGTSILKAYPDFQLHADHLRNLTNDPTLVEIEPAKSWFNNVIMQYVN